MKKALAKKSLILHLTFLRFGFDASPYFSVRGKQVGDVSGIKPEERKILIVGMSQSPHLHTWIEGLSESGLVREVWLFPSDFPTRRLRKSTIDVKEFPYFFFGQTNKFVFKILDILTNRLWRSFFLFRELQRIKPTHLHFHETQHGAYLYNSIANHPKNTFSGKVILSTWGSDLIHYEKLEDHSKQIRKVMLWCHFLTSERNIDLEVAQRHGFKGTFLSPVYITIGNKSLELKERKPSSRSIVLIKGYEDNHGRALNALASIEIIAKQLDLTKFQFKVFSASRSVKTKVGGMRLSLGLDIEVLPRMPKSDLMKIYEEARIYLGLAISDGLSTSMVEAMSHGAFPIQSSNSSAPDFLLSGVTGGVVDPYDIEGISRQLMDALLSDDLVDLAAIANIEVLKTKYNWEMGIKKLVEVYE
jgi:glycosyltransferase involved in cell wall biosynthesis